MGAMMRNDKRQSQRMMRQRVAFQLATVGALVGGMYWRAFKSGGADGGAAGEKTAVDNRVWLHSGRNYDTMPPPLPADALGEPAGDAAASGSRALR